RPLPPRPPRPPDPTRATRRRRRLDLRDHPTLAEEGLARPRGGRHQLNETHLFRLCDVQDGSRRAAYFGGIRRAPSRRIVSPLSIWLGTISGTMRAYSSGRPRREGKGMPSPSAVRASSGRAASSGVSKRPGAIVIT